MKRTAKEFSEDYVTDWAAALTYYGVLSISPGLLMLISLLGLLGPRTTSTVEQTIQDVAPQQIGTLVRVVVQQAQQSGSLASVAAIVGLLLGVLVGVRLHRRYLELHPAEGTATAVLAGHPPPVLRLNGHVDHLPVRPGPPLGVRNAQYTDTTLLLPRGSTLILYTDGLVEDRQYTLDQGFADLCTAMRTAPTDDPHQLVEHIRHTGVGPRPRRDDVAVLAVTVDVDPPPGPRTARRHFRGETASTAAARRFTYDILTAWGEQALRGDAGCRIGGRAPRGRS